MYGLSFTANLLCASATRRFASATRLARSSFGAGVEAGDPECEFAGGVETGLGVAKADDEPDAVGPPFFMAAIFAEISARFCAMRSAVTCRVS